MKKFLLSDYTWGALLTLIVLAFFHFQVPFFDNLEHMIYDARARFRLKPDITQRGDEIALVAIDDDSINKIGRWPWPRSRMAELLKKLSEYQPKAIGMNVLFSEPENPQILEELQQLEG